jgi:hypothetical protein
MLYCPLFETTKVCSVRFLRLQKFVVRFSDISVFDYVYLDGDNIEESLICLCKDD